MALSTTPTKNNPRQRWLDFRWAALWAVLIAVVMLPRLLNLDLFVGPDELAELGRNNNFALALAKGDLPGTLVGDGKPSVTLMWINTLGVTGQWLWGQVSGNPRPFEQIVAPERPFSVWPERRMFLALVSGLQILAAWPLLRRIWNWQIASVAVALMGLEPLLLAFTRMIRGDALLAGFMILSLLGALTFLKSGQQRYNWLSGAMAGLAGLTKLSGGAIVITIALLYGIALLKKAEGGNMKDENLTFSFRLHPSAFILWLLAAAVAFFGLWPAWWFRPVETFELLWNKGLYHAVEATNQQAALYFWGAVHPFGPGPWFYPVLAGLRLTPWLLLGSLVAVARWLWSTLRRRAPLDLNILGLLFYLAVYSLVITLPGQKLDRFFTPLVPALAILAAIEIVLIIQWLSEGINRHFKLGARTLHASHFTLLISTLIGLALAWHISRFHPLYSTYFNPLSGSPQFWEWALPIGHGEGVNSALLYLADQGDMSQKTLVCGTNMPRCEPFFKGNLLPQENLRSGAWFKADYVLWHVDEQQMEVFPTEVLAYLRRQPQIYMAHYHGLDYTWLYPVPRPAFLTSKARLEGVARLLGYDAGGQDFKRLAPGDTIKLHVYWQNEGQAHQQQFWWRVVDRSAYVWNEAVTQPLPAFEVEAAQKGAVVEGTAGLSLPPDIPPGAYALQAGFATAAGEVGQFPLPPVGSHLTVSGPSTGPVQPSQVLEHLVAPGLRLQGYDLSSEEATPGDTLWLTLYWQAVEAMTDHTLILRLLDQNGQAVIEEEMPPVSAVYPTSDWPVPSYVRGPHLVSLPKELAPGQYRFELALAGVTESAAVGLGTVNILTHKAVFDLPPIQFSANAVFGDVATLLGYDLAGNLSPEGARVAVTLYWQAQKPTAQPYQVKLRLVDSSSGSALAEQMAELSGADVSTHEWQTGEIIADRHELVIANSQPASVNLEIQLLADTLQPVSLTDGQPLLLVPEMQQKVSWQTH